MRAGDDVGDDFRILRIWDGRFEDTDDFGGALAETAFEAKSFADDGRILLESGIPETIGENDDASGLRTIILRPDETPEDRVEADYVEIVAADDTALYFARLTEAEQSKGDDGEITEFGKGMDTGFELLNFGDGESGIVVAYTRGALAYVD